MISKIPALVCMLLVLPATAADMAAGQRIAQTCMACHGADGVSIADNIPNIAAQKLKYIVSQLEAFKAGKRENELMNAIAAQLSAEQMADVAAYFAAKGGASDGGQQAALAPSMTKTRVAFPAEYASNFTHHTTINFESRKQVRRYLANEAALAAARSVAGIPRGGRRCPDTNAVHRCDEVAPRSSARPRGHDAVPRGLAAVAAMLDCEDRGPARRPQPAPALAGCRSREDHTLMAISKERSRAE